MSRPLLAPLTAVVLALSLTACGGGGGAATPSPTPSTTSPTAVTESPSSAPTPYAAVPDGVALTPPGTSLALKDLATVAWTPRQGLVGVVDMKVTKIEITNAAAAFKDYHVNDGTLTSTPFFVRAIIKNAGDADLGGRGLPIYVLDTSGELVEPTGFADTFKPCPGGTLPTPFAPGAKAKLCLVFLAPKDTRLSSVRFQPPVGVAPITWSGVVKVLKDHQGHRGQKRHHQRGKQ